ncbi:MAG: hypothetical protein JW819_07600 [Candidatus Krumholzibacteriota bacterium]|nr:hypothetical protein [Candidatus Krumholzibacteriota bacterium]
MSTTRRLAWPPRPGGGPAIAELVEEIAAAMDAAAPPAGGALLLVEAQAGGEELPRLAERLAAHWEGAGRTVLVVDAHPAAPFTSALFAPGAEGFTELLLYGVSPQALGRTREGAAGRWIPAGGPWSLPLDAPEEPARSLRRLAAASERILILADAGDAEGLLDAMRQAAAFRLVLAAEAPAAEAPAPPPVAAEAPPVPPHIARREMAAPGGMAAEDTGSDAPRRLPVPDLQDDPPRYRLWFLLAAAVVVILLGIWWFLGRREAAPPAPPRGAEAGAPERNLRALPDRAALPWQGERSTPDSLGRAAEDSLAALASRAADAPPLDDAAAGVRDAATAPAGPAAAPARNDADAGPPSAAGGGETAAPRRRYESRATWQVAQDHAGAFHVMVESYLDSTLAARSGRERGFDRIGIILRRARVRDRDWYRLCVGPFPDLAAAAAFRDSLLDTTGEDYCIIGLEPTD